MKDPLKVIIGSDHDGQRLKASILDALKQDGYECEDARDTGTDGLLPVAGRVCGAVLSGEYDRGILVSETGQGMNIMANKFTGIRSAICHNAFTARLSCTDTDANVLCLGAWCVKPDDGVQIARAWLASRYADKNVYSLDRMRQFEKEHEK